MMTLIISTHNVCKRMRKAKRTKKSHSFLKNNKKLKRLLNPVKRNKTAKKKTKIGNRFTKAAKKKRKKAKILRKKSRYRAKNQSK